MRVAKLRASIASTGPETAPPGGGEVEGVKSWFIEVLCLGFVLRVGDRAVDTFEDEDEVKSVERGVLRSAGTVVDAAVEDER